MIRAGSAALIADAANNATDLISDGVTATAVTMARRPADALHPFGIGAYREALWLSACLRIFAAGF